MYLRSNDCVNIVWNAPQRIIVNIRGGKKKQWMTREGERSNIMDSKGTTRNERKIPSHQSIILALNC